MWGSQIAFDTCTKGRKIVMHSSKYYRIDISFTQKKYITKFVFHLNLGRYLNSQAFKIQVKTWFISCGHNKSKLTLI